MEARDRLLDLRTDYCRAYDEFSWPPAAPFNWAIDWFDGVLAKDPDRKRQAALRFIDVDDTETIYSFEKMSARSGRVANYLLNMDVQRGDRVLVVFGNVVQLWDVMLAAIKINAVVIPATPMLTSTELDDRIVRGSVQHIVAESAQTAKFAGLPSAAGLTRICADTQVAGWHNLEDAHRADYSHSLPSIEPTQPTSPCCSISCRVRPRTEARRAHAPQLPRRRSQYEVLARLAAG